MTNHTPNVSFANRIKCIHLLACMIPCTMLFHSSGGGFTQRSLGFDSGLLHVRSKKWHWSSQFSFSFAFPLLIIISSSLNIIFFPKRGSSRYFFLGERGRFSRVQIIPADLIKCVNDSVVGGGKTYSFKALSTNMTSWGCRFIKNAFVYTATERTLPLCSRRLCGRCTWSRG